VLAPAHVCLDPRYRTMASATGTVLCELDNSAAVEHFHGVFGFAIWQWLWHHVLKNHFAKLDSAAYDVVHVTYFDDFDKATAVLGSPFGRHAFTGLLMNVRFHHAEMEVPRSRVGGSPLQNAVHASAGTA